MWRRNKGEKKEKKEKKSNGVDLPKKSKGEGKRKGTNNKKDANAENGAEGLTEAEQLQLALRLSLEDAEKNSRPCPFASEDVLELDGGVLLVSEPPAAQQQPGLVPPQAEEGDGTFDPRWLGDREGEGRAEQKEGRRTTEEKEDEKRKKKSLGNGNGAMLPRKRTTGVRNLLSEMGLVRVRIPKDGSCLFRAVSEKVFMTQASHLEVRRLCVAYMRAYRSDFEPFLAYREGEETFDSYTERMLLPTTWGGHNELQSMSKLFCVNFIIYNSSGRPTVMDNGFNSSIALWYAHGNHYDLVYSKREMEAMAVCQEIVLSLVDTLFGTEPKLPSSNKPSYRNLQLELWKRETKEQQKYDELVAEQLEVERKIESDREKQDEELAKLLARESRRRQREQELKDRELARRLHRVEATRQSRIEEQLRQESYCYEDDAEKQKRRKKKEKKKEKKGNGGDENEKTAKEELEDEDLRLARKLQREELKKRDKALGIRVVQRIPRSSSSSSTTKPTKERKKDDRRKHSPSPPSLPEEY
ncbi:N-acetylglucosaminyldiphosphodolichol N-acetylglucosaminyltransferase catalytic subunit alg13 [Balamuthia mandrillaris]